MKKLYTIVLAILFTGIAVGQVPDRVSYQAVIRDTDNNLLVNSTVGMQISILQGSSSGTAVYIEEHSVSTNANGLVSLIIGDGFIITGELDTIDWALGPYFIKTETDPLGGTNYTISGTNQLLSVPYALYAKNSGSSIPGPVGAMGPPGDDGEDGDIGDVGVQGEPGVDGQDGLPGIQGESGLDGVDGAQGIQGNQGIQGEIGLQGIQGLLGPSGDDGIDGSVGATGPQGDQGIEGDQGIQGEIGLQGIQGLLGPAGDDGIDGSVGATGPQGDQGIQGEQGADGADGATLTGDGGQINVVEGVISFEPIQTVIVVPYIGMPDYGGIVFHVSGFSYSFSGEIEFHGLVVAMVDQSDYSNWYEAQDIISDSTNFDATGQVYTNWRLPTLHELNLIYDVETTINATATSQGGDTFPDSSYWTSKEQSYDGAYIKNFFLGSETYSNKTLHFRVRAVRSF